MKTIFPYLFIYYRSREIGKLQVKVKAFLFSFPMVEVLQGERSCQREEGPELMLLLETHTLKNFSTLAVMTVIKRQMFRLNTMLLRSQSFSS